VELYVRRREWSDRSSRPAVPGRLPDDFGIVTVNVRAKTVASRTRFLRTFRAHLHYRLNVFTIFMPPLREPRTDITLLAEHFVEKHSSRAR
jgi:transcriptional regulator with AAA-type ATPase domain